MMRMMRSYEIRKEEEWGVANSRTTAQESDLGLCVEGKGWAIIPIQSSCTKQRSNMDLIEVPTLLTSFR